MAGKKGETQIDWDFVVDSIRTEKTVIFLGPGIDLAGTAGPTKQSELLKNFSLQNSGHVIKYHKQDDLLIFHNEQARIIAKSKMSTPILSRKPYSLNSLRSCFICLINSPVLSNRTL